MPKFVPRQRKHKAIARAKANNAIVEPEIDSNVIEHIPAAKVELEEKKRLVREELRKDGTKVSGKKAKRLEKYIENKLKKDENRELISQLANSRTDTSHYQSSRKLGQGRETRRERLGKALQDHRAGITIDDENNELLFEPRLTRQDEDDTSSDESNSPSSEGPVYTQSTKPLRPPISVVKLGGGLKRPLDIDEKGIPVLKKRKRRGGVITKVSYKHVPQEEPEWAGFKSESEADSNTDEDIPESIAGYDDISNASVPEESDNPSDSDISTQGSRNSADTTEADDMSTDGSEDEKGNSQGKERSSAFKTWATQQLSDALGYQPLLSTPIATETAKISGFKPRESEQDPLPAELQTTGDASRKAFSVPVERTLAIQEARLQLPVVAEEQKIMEAFHNNNLIVIYGATGSGKTTQVPQFLFEAGYGSSNSPTPGMVGITQPRRVAAVSMAKRVGEELGNEGKKVAYQIRFEGTTSKHTAIKFMTDGVLLREVAQDIALRKYSAVIIDEAHERSVNTDILIGMLSRVVKLREEMSIEDASIAPLKLVIMSATLRVSDFTENKTLFSSPPPVLQAEGRQYPVITHFARKTHHNYVDEAFRKVSKGHKKLPPGGFLVFLTGQNEITQLSKRLKEAFRIGYSATGLNVKISSSDVPMEAEDIDFGDISGDRHDDFDDEEVDIFLNDDEDFEIGEEADTGPAKMHVLPLYSLLPTKDQLKVFEPPPDGARLIVLATNVAETSLTIPGIRYVFDCGRSKERKYDRVTGVQSFEVGWISKASASQRAGRAGRTGPGHCYRLYSSAVYERDFEDFAEPEILRMPIEGVVLQLKAMNLQHVVNFPFPTPPDRQSLATAEKLLTYLSAISPTGQITAVGSTMSIFPLSPRFARILLVGHQHGCLPFTIALVAGLSAADIFIPENQVVPASIVKDEGEFFTNDDRIAESSRENIRRNFSKIQHDLCSFDDKSDALKLLNVIQDFAQEPTEAWCHTHYVRYKVLKEILQLRRQITELLARNIPAFATLKYEEKLEEPTGKQLGALKQMVAAGFIDHVAIRADLAPNLPETGRRKPSRAIDVPYLTLFPSHAKRNDEDKAVYIHPSSPLAHLSIQELPEYIVYSYLQRAPISVATPSKIPKTRMHALTDIKGKQLAALAKGTPLLTYSKPIKEVMPKMGAEANIRECWVIPSLRAEGTGGQGWPLPAVKVSQKKVAGRGWVVE